MGSKPLHGRIEIGNVAISLSRSLITYPLSYPAETSASAQKMASIHAPCSQSKRSIKPKRDSRKDDGRELELRGRLVATPYFPSVFDRLVPIRLSLREREDCPSNGANDTQRGRYALTHGYVRRLRRTAFRTAH
jgi:hypothetical protein